MVESDDSSLSAKWVNMNTSPNVVHIRLNREGDWPPFDSEEVAAVRLEEHKFQISSAPAFAKRLAVGDIVRVAHYGPSQDPWIEEVLAWSGNSTIRVIVFASAGKVAEEELIQGVGELGGVITPPVLSGLFVLNVPKGVDYGRMRTFLDKGESRGVWEYEEAAISANHSNDPT